MHCSVAEDEETESIDVMDVSDFGGDDNGDMSDEVPQSPRPPRHPRPQSHAAEHGSPRGLSTGRRLHARNRHDTTWTVCLGGLLSLSVYHTAVFNLFSSSCESCCSNWLLFQHNPSEFVPVLLSTPA